MDESRPSPALIIFGPTASGKSALALDLARQFSGTIINADSMQVYRELRVLTARPSVEEEERVPHALYGVRAASAPSNAAWWREAALTEMERAQARGRLPILCGGTGLYLRALTQGLAEIPDPGAAARAEGRALLVEIGPEALHARLALADPQTAARLHPSDSQRVARAWEVWRGTGRGLSSWQAQPVRPLPGWRFLALVLDPPRPVLRAAIAARVREMFVQGAVEEVRDLLALNLDPALPAMRAQGVLEIATFLAGNITLEEAAQWTILATGRYAKRQATWLRHQPIVPLTDIGGSGNRLIMIQSRFPFSAQYLESLTREIFSFIHASS